MHISFGVPEAGGPHPALFGAGDRLRPVSFLPYLATGSMNTVCDRFGPGSEDGTGSSGRRFGTGSSRGETGSGGGTGSSGRRFGTGSSGGAGTAPYLEDATVYGVVLEDAVMLPLCSAARSAIVHCIPYGSCW